MTQPAGAILRSGSNFPQQHRIRKILLLLGAVAVATFYHAAGSLFFTNSHKNAVDGFEQVTADEEEDFTASSSNSITTVDLASYADLQLPPPPAISADKPNLILHVGPIKTGVERLAQALVNSPELKDALQEDQYVIAMNREASSNTTSSYTSPVDTSALHYDCQHELNEIRRQFLTSKKHLHHHTLPETIARVPCWKAFLEELEPLKQSQTNVVIADEQLSSKVILDAVAVNGAAAILDWDTVRETLFPDWNVIVVINYRRYYQWLLSAKAAAEQVHLLQQHSQTAPRLARWPAHERGMLLEPLFPHFVQGAEHKLDVPYTHRLVQLYPPQFVSAVRLLNLHSGDYGNHMVTQFLCDVLPDAAAACAAAHSSVLPSNDELLETAADAKWYDFELIDELVNEAQHRMYLRWRHCSRTAATITTEYYVTQHLHLQPRQLPLQCPLEPAAQAFLDESVHYEQRLLGEQHAAADHAKEYWDWARTTQLLCNIDMGGILKQSQWRAFFRHLTNRSADKIRSGERRPGSPRRLRMRQWL